MSLLRCSGRENIQQDDARLRDLHQRAAVLAKCPYRMPGFSYNEQVNCSRVAMALQKALRDDRFVVDLHFIDRFLVTAIYLIFHRRQSNIDSLAEYALRYAPQHADLISLSDRDRKLVHELMNYLLYGWDEVSL